MKSNGHRQRNGLIVTIFLLLIVPMLFSACGDSDNEMLTSSRPLPPLDTPAPEEFSMEYDYDPDVEPIIQILPKLDFADVDLVRFRTTLLQSISNLFVDVRRVIEEDDTIENPDGGPDIPIRIYRPAGKDAPVPALLSIHGGGFTVGGLESDRPRAADLVNLLGIVVVSVDYRLAPENPYPAALNDCYATLVWIHENATALNIDRERIGVIGSSAGGGLAAAVALKARDSNGPSLCFQFLDIPELDDRLNTVSAQTFVDTPVWYRHNAELSWKYYLGEGLRPGSSAVPPYAAPARATDLSGLPPAYVSAMEFDPLRDEGILYALGLMQAGVKVELHMYPGTFHGSAVVVPTVISSKRFHEEMVYVLRRVLGLD